MFVYIPELGLELSEALLGDGLGRGLLVNLRKQCYGSVSFWYGSGLDPDPRIRFVDKRIQIRIRPKIHTPENVMKCKLFVKR